MTNDELKPGVESIRRMHQEGFAEGHRAAAAHRPALEHVEIGKQRALAAYWNRTGGLELASS